MRIKKNGKVITLTESDLKKITQKYLKEGIEISKDVTANQIATGLNGKQISKGNIANGVINIVVDGKEWSIKPTDDDKAQMPGEMPDRQEKSGWMD
jgi:hypothetical protein